MTRPARATGCRGGALGSGHGSLRAPGRDRATRPRDRLRAHQHPPGNPRVPLGPHPGPELRPLPHLRRTEHRAPTLHHGRVHWPHPETLRRHGARPRRRARARAGQRRGAGSCPADEPDAPRLRNPRRRPALRPRDLRRLAGAVGRGICLAALHRGGAHGDDQLLPRPRSAHGHQRHPDDVHGLRDPDGVLRARPRRLRRRGAGRRRRDPRPPWHLRAPPVGTPVRGAAACVLAHGRPPPRRLPLPPAPQHGQARMPRGTGRPRARRAAVAAADRTTYGRQSPTVRSYPDGYRVEELGTFPGPGSPGCPGCPARHERT